MNCQRCQGIEDRYRVYTDLMNLRVCTSCAIKALDIGISGHNSSLSDSLSSSWVTVSHKRISITGGKP